jgi:hypothetical protein
MKRAIVSLFFVGLFCNLPLQAEPFNNRGTNYIEKAPIGSSAPRPMVEPDIGPFKRRGRDYLSTAPTGSSRPSARVKPEIKGFNDRSVSTQLY